MATAMNRSIPAIVAAGSAAAAARRPAGTAPRRARHHGRDAAIQHGLRRQVIVVPGYGMAVAQAQHAVKDMAELLEARASRSSTRSTRSPAGCPGT
jgi:NAD(P) transhydrogenase subunit beta